MNSIAPKPGNEIRGFVFRLYPTPEQEELLESIEGKLKYVWNTCQPTMCRSTTATVEEQA